MCVREENTGKRVVVHSLGFKIHKKFGVVVVVVDVGSKTQS